MLKARNPAFKHRESRIRIGGGIRSHDPETPISSVVVRDDTTRPRLRRRARATAALLFLNVFVDNAFISPSNTQTMHLKSFYTQQHCCVSLKAL
jgi:hypothetical protein